MLEGSIPAGQQGLVKLGTKRRVDRSEGVDLTGGDLELVGDFRESPASAQESQRLVSQRQRENGPRDGPPPLAIRSATLAAALVAPAERGAGDVSAVVACP
ncbi:hypothetical protein [Streptomyces sp. NPDC056670]|uniref:hypothetical protein n=1 Tax=Streptomyces sp. NPDC056670 TaxID=3345904 RepID=UPI0036B3AA68